MVDDPDARAGSDAAHLESCAECEARFKSASEDAHSIATLLAVPDLHVDVARAFNRVTSEPKARPAFGIRLPVMRGFRRPLTLTFVAAVAAAALVIVGFAASGFFYKPTTVRAVPVTVADIQALSQLANYGTITWTQQPNFQAATSASDAAQTAGFPPPVVTNLPSGVSTTVTYGATTKAVATFTFSAAKAAAAAAASGKTLPPMPAGMDGATLTVTVGPAVGEIYGNLPQQGGGSDPNQINLPQLIVAKSAAPTATSSQVTVTQLEDFILAQPGITPELKAAVQAIGDPSTTLLIPVPVAYATSTPVTVTGEYAGDGVALGDNTGLGSGVVWVAKDGYVYVVAGSIKQTDAIDIANSLK